MTDHQPQIIHSLVGEQVRKPVILMQCDGIGIHRMLWNFKEYVG